MERQASDVIAVYNEAKSLRSPREPDWRLAAAYCLPQHYGAWSTEGPVTFGANGVSSARRTVFDSTGMRSLPKYMAILERLATPAGVRYQTLSPSNKYLLKSARVRQFFDELSNLHFTMRENAKSGFRTASNEVYSGMGVYGTGPVFCGQRPITAVNRSKGFMYKACQLRDIFIIVDDNGEVVAVFRRMWMNFRQWKAKFKKQFDEGKIPKAMEAESKKANPSETVNFEIVHYVYVRSIDEHDPSALDAKRHPVASRYVCVQSQEFIGEESGYANMPYLTPRTFTIAGDPYGFSPAQLALSSLGGASSIKKVYLKQGNKAADPVLLTPDDGIMNGEIDQRPGAINPGGLDRQGRKLVQALETGNFQVAERLLEMDIAAAEDSFFVFLFTILKDRPEMTATQVVEEAGQVTSMLSPTMGRLQSEFLAPLTEREIGLISEMGLMPQIPPELEEAKGEYEIQYTSPMAKGVYAEETAGFMRTLETAINLVSATQDPSHLDHFDLDVAIPEIAYNNATPQRWMRTMEAVEKIREDRADQTQNAELLKNAGGLAQAGKVAMEAEASQ